MCTNLLLWIFRVEQSNSSPEEKSFAENICIIRSQKYQNHKLIDWFFMNNGGGEGQGGG